MSFSLSVSLIRLSSRWKARLSGTGAERCSNPALFPSSLPLSIPFRLSLSLAQPLDEGRGVGSPARNQRVKERETPLAWLRERERTLDFPLVPSVISRVDHSISSFYFSLSVPRFGGISLSISLAPFSSREERVYHVVRPLIFEERERGARDFLSRERTPLAF